MFFVVNAKAFKSRSIRHLHRLITDYLGKMGKAILRPTLQIVLENVLCLNSLNCP